MTKQASGEYGVDVWIANLEKKIRNMERAISMGAKDEPVQVFPEGRPVTVPFNRKRGSSVK